MTRYLLKGPNGYVGARTDWTHNIDDAHWYCSSESAHRAQRLWLQEHNEMLSVIVRNGSQLIHDIQTHDAA